MKTVLEKLGLAPVSNASQWKRKWTTWLQALQLGFLALIGMYMLWPDRLQDRVPGWLELAVIIGAGLTTFATVVAANVLQTKLSAPIQYRPLTPTEDLFKKGDPP